MAHITAQTVCELRSQQENSGIIIIIMYSLLEEIQR